jgi:UPF0716 protein FxsA
MLVFLVLIFIAVPLAELYVIIKVGEAIGALNTIALLILDSIVGVALLRSQGRRAWARFNQALAEGRVPGKEIADGALIIVGGALLLTPGFISDALGVLLLIPPTRAVIRGILARTAFRRMAIGHRTVAWGWESARGSRDPFGPRPERDGRDFDVEGTAHEVDDSPHDHGSEPPALPR